MKLIGFNFTKISAEKKGDLIKDLKISNDIDITEIKKTKSEIFKEDEDLLEINFKYLINYDPNIAKIILEGTLLIAVKPKESKEILKSWKNKKMSDEFKFSLFNIILRKSGVKALSLEEEMNLPYHIRLPMVKKQEE
ncbi:MAG: hypothetical protein ACE5ES_02385 [Candidatus Nanoarchaeia archaeon]